MNGEVEALIAAARAAREQAYAPYSRFAVGAALRLADGAILTGANVENASYGLSLCAETVAVATASAAGRLPELTAVAVAGGPIDGAPLDRPLTPCGRCRQVLHEAQQRAGRPIIIHCAGAEGPAIASHRLDDLLPHAFDARDLARDDR
jgi:cytidine deaminase